jgi:hypothetical protein
MSDVLGPLASEFDDLSPQPDFGVFRLLEWTRMKAGVTVSPDEVARPTLLLRFSENLLALRRCLNTSPWPAHISSSVPSHADAPTAMARPAGLVGRPGSDLTHQQTPS